MSLISPSRQPPAAKSPSRITAGRRSCSSSCANTYERSAVTMSHSWCAHTKNIPKPERRSSSYWGMTCSAPKDYAEQLKAPFPILSDPERALYARFTLTKNFIGIQRTAAVIVDQKGVIVYIKRATNPLTWLQENQELLEAAKF